ncbi:MAG: esterase [Elusimicrobia bacterium]|nr:esterase [Elusimicrobiota bacterium]
MANLALPRRRTIGPLSVIEVAAGPEAPADRRAPGTWTAGGEAPVIVCFHGYGADASDLAPLAEEVPVSRPVRWIFPDAPFKLGPFIPGRMWFPVDEETLRQSQVLGKPWDLSGVRPAGLDEAQKLAGEFLDSLETAPNRLALGGFSQGSMLAVELTLRAPEPPLGLFILSGNLVDEPSMKELAPARAGTPFFQSHGRMDPLLGYEGAQKLEAALKAAGLVGELYAFAGGHAVPAEAALRLGRFLDGLFGAFH